MNQELVDKVLAQIVSDIAFNIESDGRFQDYTAIEELLKAIPEHLLVGFLIEGDAE
jgi:hypothetical protein